LAVPAMAVGLESRALVTVPFALAQKLGRWAQGSMVAQAFWATRFPFLHWRPRDEYLIHLRAARLAPSVSRIRAIVDGVPSTLPPERLLLCGSRRMTTIEPCRGAAVY